MVYECGWCVLSMKSLRVFFFVYIFSELIWDCIYLFLFCFVSISLCGWGNPRVQVNCIGLRNTTMAAIARPGVLVTIGGADS